MYILIKFKVMKQFILLSAFLTLVSCASILVSSDYDTAVDFSTYSTYAFFKPGIDNAKISDLDKRRILKALENTMQTKGLTA